jgi:hypothetical protein
MVSREEFEDAQRILGRTMRPRPQKHSFPFVGLMSCGNCGGSITAEVHVKKSGRKFTYYRCTRRRKDVPCREPALSAPELDRQFGELIARVHIPPKTHAWLTREAKGDFEKDAARFERTRGSLQTAITGVKRELGELLSLRLRKLLTDDAFLAKKAELEGQQGRLDQQLARVVRTGSEANARVRVVLDFAARAHETFRFGTGVQRRMILEAAGLNYTLTSRSIKLAWTEPLSLVEKAASRLDWSGLVDDVRTLILDKGVSVARLEAALKSMACSMPEHAAAT